VWARLQAGHWGVRPNSTTYTALMEGHLGQGQPRAVKQLYDAMMSQHLVPSVAAYTHLITAYGQLGLWPECLAVLSHVNR
jgi:pentatricopeptide repeat protein